jgi:hypothetical protein
MQIGSLRTLMRRRQSSTQIPLLSSDQLQLFPIRALSSRFIRHQKICGLPFPYLRFYDHVLLTYKTLFRFLSKIL